MKDQLLVDKTILENCRRRLTNLSTTWIEYRKAYNMVPHSSILKCLNMFGTARNIIILIGNSTANWKTVLTPGGIRLRQVDIKRGIFQGDSISLCCNHATTKLRKMKAEDRLHKNTTPINHLLFTDDLKLYGTNRDQLDPLVQTVRIFSEDIQMSYLDWTSVQCWKGKKESKSRARE